MTQSHTSLPKNPQQLYEESRREYTSNLEELQKFNAEECKAWRHKTGNIFDDPLAYFERTYNENFVTLPQNTRALEEKNRLLNNANDLMRELIALQKAALQHKASNKAWFEASREAWIHATQLGQYLFQKDTIWDNYSLSIPWGTFTKTINTATALISSPSEAQAQALIASTKNLNEAVEGKPQQEESRLYRGFIGTLLFLAGTVISAFGVIVSAFLAPTGLYLIPGILLGFIGGLMMGAGFNEIVEAIYPKPKVEPQRTRDERSLIDSTRDTSQSFSKLASTFFSSSPQPNKNDSEPQKEPPPLFHFVPT